jgi:hypothetical protein
MPPRIVIVVQCTTSCRLQLYCCELDLPTPSRLRTFGEAKQLFGQREYCMFSSRYAPPPHHQAAGLTNRMIFAAVGCAIFKDVRSDFFCLWIFTTFNIPPVDTVAARIRCIDGSVLIGFIVWRAIERIAIE